MELKMEMQYVKLDIENIEIQSYTVTNFGNATWLADMNLSTDCILTRHPIRIYMMPPLSMQSRKAQSQIARAATNAFYTIQEPVS